MEKEFFAECVARHAQHERGFRLVLSRPFHGDLENRTLDAANHHVVHISRIGVAEVAEILLKAQAHGLFKEVIFFHGSRCVQFKPRKDGLN